MTAFLNASLIFIYDELRECPKWTNICTRMAERIYSGLDMVDLLLLRRHCPDIFLWILLLGRAGNHPLAKGGGLWFRRMISIMWGDSGDELPSALVGLGYFEVSERMVSGSETQPILKSETGVRVSKK